MAAKFQAAARAVDGAAFRGGPAEPARLLTEFGAFRAHYSLFDYMNAGARMAVLVIASGGGCAISAERAEDIIATFDPALEQPRKMEMPRWGQPIQESGNWGTVSGQTWGRIRLAELEGLSQ